MVEEALLAEIGRIHAVGVQTEFVQRGGRVGEAVSIGTQQCMVKHTLINSEFSVPLRLNPILRITSVHITDSDSDADGLGSEEVLGSLLDDVGLTAPGRGVELQVGLAQVLVHLDDGRLVGAPVAVVGRREDRHESVLMRGLVALLDELVRPRDLLEAVGVVELHGDVLHKGSRTVPKVQPAPRGLTL